jgi:hypothetical protein
VFPAQVFVQGGLQAEGHTAVWALIAGAARPQAMHAAVAVVLAALGTGIGTLVTGIGLFALCQRLCTVRLLLLVKCFPQNSQLPPGPRLLPPDLGIFLGDNLALYRISSLCFGDSPQPSPLGPA